AVAAERAVDLEPAESHHRSVAVRRANFPQRSDRIDPRLRPPFGMSRIVLLRVERAPAEVPTDELSGPMESMPEVDPHGGFRAISRLYCGGNAALIIP